MSAAPPPPPAAQRLVGDALPTLESYAERLATSGIQWGVIGPREVDRLWDRHLLNCAAVAELIPARGVVVDVGSGAGLPGIVLAACRPDLAMTLVEPIGRRCRFLEETVSELGLVNVSVRQGRAEELAGSLAARSVTARAVAPLTQLLGIAWPLVAPGGELLAMKGRTAPNEVESAANELARIGAIAEIARCGGVVLQSPTTVVRVHR